MVQGARKFTRLLDRFRGDLLFTIATVASTGVAFLGSLISARYISPEDLGIVQALLLFPAYMSFLHLGVFNGLGRNVALYLGKGDVDKVQRMIDGSWAVAKAMALLGAALSTGLLLYYWKSGRPVLYRWGTTVVFVSLVAGPPAQLLDIVYLSTKHFKRLGRNVMWQNLINFVCGFLPVILNVSGLLAAKCVASFAKLWLNMKYQPRRPKGSGSWSEVCELSRTGAPLLVAGVLYTYVSVADRSVVACFLTPKDLGQFVLSGLVVAAATVITQCIGMLLYPRVAEDYGKHGSHARLRRYVWLSLGLSFSALGPACVVIYFAIEPLTRSVFPKYVDGIGAAKIACLGSIGTVYFAGTNINAVMRKNTPVVAGLAAALLAIWLLGYGFVKAGWGIGGVAAARSIVGFLTGGFLLWYQFYLTRPGGETPLPATALKEPAA